MLYGTILGTVTDASQGVVAGALVRIVSPATGLSRDTFANERGDYVFPTLPSGTYTITVSAQGFGEAVREGVTVSPNDTVRINFTLQVGGLAERIVVTAAPPLLQTDRAEVRAEVSEEKLENLPLPPGRNYQALLFTLPGMGLPTTQKAVATGPSRAMNFRVNGTDTTASGTRIDGATQTNIWQPDVTAYVPALEAIESFNVVTNSPDAELGMAGGASIQVNIKSGTNEFHGSAFEYHQNDALNAKPVLLPSNFKKPKYLVNQFGGTLGGPIKKDKLFFFGSYELTRDRSNGQRFVTLPTAAMKRGDMSGSPNPIYNPFTGNPDGSGRTAFSGNQIPRELMDPVIQKLIPLIPDPNVPNTISNNYFVMAPYNTSRDLVDAKINWNASEKFNMYGRLGYMQWDHLNTEILGQLGGFPIVRNPEGDPGKGWGYNFSTTIAGNYSFSPRVVLDAYFGFTKMVTSDEQIRLGENLGSDFLGIPGTNGPRRFESGWPRFMPGWTGIQASNFTPYGVAVPWMPYYRWDPQYNYVANLGWIKGSHNIRLGGELVTQKIDHAQAEFPGVAYHGPQGGFGFTGGPTALRGGPSPNLYNEFATFLLGLSTHTGRNLQVPDRMVARGGATSFYIRDQWQAAPKLTLNIGLRWDYYFVPKRGDRGVELYNPATNKMRICGVGNIPEDCDLNMGKTQFSPRFGLAYRATESFVIRTGYGLSWNPRPVIGWFRTNYPIMVAFNMDAPNSFSWASRVRDGIPAINPPDFSSGEVELPGTYGVSTTGQNVPRDYIQSWNLTLQKQLGQDFTMQAGYVATRTVGYMSRRNINAGKPGGGVASQPLYQKFGRTATTFLIDAMGNIKYDSLQVQVGRRFSQGYSFSASYTWSKNLDGNAFVPLPEYEWRNNGPNSLDLTHALVINGIMELPFGRSKKWLNQGGIVSAIFGGWQINGIFQVYSGWPFTVSASATSLNAPGIGQTADQVKPEVKILGGTGPGQSYFDPLAFAPVTQARFGTAGYNTLRGPTSVNLDAGIFKRMQLSEGVDLEFRAEAFNFTNTPHWANPGSNVSTMSRNADGTIRSLGGYTEITSTRRNGRENIDERVLRFGLRLKF